MNGVRWRVVAGGCLAGLAAGIGSVGTGSAQAEPSNCIVEQGLTNAATVCHGGDGTASIGAECMGFYIPPAQVIPIFGPYLSPRSPEVPVGTGTRASCLSQRSIGIVTGTVVRPA